jgi:hypothetical protein
MGARFSPPVQTGPGAHPASNTMGTGSFPEVKRPARGADHPPQSSAEVIERVELYLYSPSWPPWPVRVLYFGQGVPEFLSYRARGDAARRGVFIQWAVGRILVERERAVPLQAWSGPERSRKLRFPDFMTTAQDGCKVVSLTHRPPLPPGG